MDKIQEPPTTTQEDLPMTPSTALAADLTRWWFYQSIGQPWGKWADLTERQHNRLRLALAMGAASLRIQARF